MAKRSEIDLEWLCRQLSQGRSAKEIAFRAGLAASSVNYLIRKYELPYSRKGEATDLERMNELLYLAMNASHKINPSPAESKRAERAKRLGLKGRGLNRQYLKTRMIQGCLEIGG